jgi:hypothetical protein
MIFINWLTSFVLHKSSRLLSSRSWSLQKQGKHLLCSTDSVMARPLISATALRNLTELFSISAPQSCVIDVLWLVPMLIISPSVS